MSNSGSFGSFELNSIVRGAQLTVVGANRALQNPSLFTSELYKQAALAVVAGLAIRLLVAIPTIGIRVLLQFLGLFTDLSESTWDADIIEGISFIENSVLQIPFFLMTFIRQLSPAMDHLFMESLQWVDQTYIQKHKTDDPSQLRAMYYPNLRLYSQQAPSAQKKEPCQALKAFCLRFGKKAAVSLGVYLLSLLPYVGRFVLPAASFYTFNKASYFSSRTLMRELLDPYFSRIRYTPEQKKQWFHDREGVLFGFAFAFVSFLKIPLLGVLIYGIAEASTAYLVTKITEPPPEPQRIEEFKKEDIHWKNKHEFVSLPLDAIDKLNTTLKEKRHSATEPEVKAGRQFS
ncbi:hypothetical protein BST61_g10594 [Cercospora zeina]